jgi:uncharacterized protein (DUF2267 family)
MRLTKRIVQAAGIAAGVIGVAAASSPDNPVGKAARRLARDIRYAVASAPGVLYRLAGRHPDPNVSDDVLADRIRSTIGPLEQRLDIPRIHVMVEDHVAVLHGDVNNDLDAYRIEHAVLDISGVDGVESHLHLGLIAGDTRPSEGRAHPAASPALVQLLDAARSAGARDPRQAVHAVLCNFSERIPDGEREQFFAHLPTDVRALAGPPHRQGERLTRLRTVPELLVAVGGVGGVELDKVEKITRHVVAALRALSPDEERDVAASLPHELRDLWLAAPATTAPSIAESSTESRR